MNNRVRFFRKNILNLSQKKFGEKIGLKQSTINDIESGKNKLTDSNLKLICQIFNINEEWLRNGTEPIFIEKGDEPLIDLIEKEFDLSPLSKSIVNTYLNLSKEDRLAFENFFTKLTSEIHNDDNNNLNNKPQLKLIGFGGDNETKELNQEQANLNIKNFNNENNNL